MIVAEFSHLPHGVYRVHWDDGGHSLASLGSCSDGRRWLAPSNWMAPLHPDNKNYSYHVLKIQQMELIGTGEPEPK